MRYGPWWLAIGIVAVFGCAEERETVYDFQQQVCLDIPWDELPAASGEIETLSCDTTLDCPPPLQCVTPGEDSVGVCQVIRQVREPEAVYELYDKPSFRVTVTPDDDYNFLNFVGLPAAAAFVQCNFYVCPIDADVIRRARKRCLFHSEVVDLATVDTMALTALIEGPEQLAFASRVPACREPKYADVGADGVLNSKVTVATEDKIAIFTATTGFFGYCMAFGETDLEAVSSVFSLDRDEMGQNGREAYTSNCSAPNTLEGTPCLRYDGTDADGDPIEDPSPGACFQGLCCPSCFGAQECRPYASSGNDPACYAMAGLGLAADGAVQPPFIGRCAPALCSDERGVQYTVDSEGERTSTASGSNQDAGMGMPADGGMRPDGGMPAGDAAPRPDAGLPDMAPAADMDPAADMAPADDMARMPPRMQ